MIERHLEMFTMMVIEVQVFQVFGRDTVADIGAGMSIRRIYHLGGSDRVRSINTYSAGTL